ncbi:MAG: hypothetical protein H7062_05385 [Candidatus Saccharimonas sp.]|nr:hypothetical protein [Planctomycetaceae bacterium]
MVDDFELEQLRRYPEWRVALTVYHDLQVQARERSSEFDGWIPRVTEVETIDTAALPSIHGKLIAFGFLKFDLSGRDAGMCYQLTPLGKQALLGKGPLEEETSQDEAALAQLV